MGPLATCMELGLPLVGLSRVCGVAGARFSGAQRLPVWNGKAGASGSRWSAPASSLCPDASRSPSRFITHSASLPERPTLSRWSLNTGDNCSFLWVSTLAFALKGLCKILSQTHRDQSCGFRNQPGNAWEEQPAVSLFKILTT